MLFTPEGGIHLVDFDYCICDLPIHDLVNFLRRVAKFTDYDEDVICLAFRAYLERNPLPLEELQLFAPWLWPQKFWETAHQYYGEARRRPRKTYADRLRRRCRTRKQERHLLETGSQDIQTRLEKAHTSGGRRDEREKTMARICIDARPAVIARGTGIGNYTYQLIQFLAVLDQEHEYYLLWPDDGTEPLPMPPRFHFHPMSAAGKGKQRSCPGGGWRAKGDRALPRADNGLHAFPAQSCPMIVTIHDLIPRHAGRPVRRGYRRNFLEKVPKAAQEACYILTVSQTAKGTSTVF